MADPIPFNRIFKGTEEQEAVARVLAGEHWHGNGAVSRQAENELSQWLGAKHVFLTTSCTHALETAMMALEIGPGDQVIMPSFTFVSTANAVLMRGGTPIFADISSHDLNLDANDVARKMSAAVKAVVPVHYAGIPVDFDALRQAAGPDVSIVEDAAQAIGSLWKGRALGTIGDIGCLSFHDTKNITCGEGGAFLTNDDALAQRAEWMREKGTNRSAFLRGETDKYTWVSQGSSYIPSELLAAVLLVQLSRREEIFRRRKHVWETYARHLKMAESRGWIALPGIPSYATGNYHLYYLRVNRSSDRDPLLKAFRQSGIEASFHYIPLHNAPFSRTLSRSVEPLPVTEKMAASIIRLPVYPDLADRIEEVAERASAVVNRYYNR